MLTAFLLFCGTNGYQGIVEAKFAAFCVICGGYILVMGIAALEGILVGAVKPQSPISILRKTSWPQRLAIAYMILTWVSVALSPYWKDSIIGTSRYEGAVTITIYGVCFLLVSVFGRVSKQMLWTLGASVLLFCVLSILQLAGYNPLTLYPDGYNYMDANVHYGGAYLGTVGNIDLVAAFLCLAIPVMWIGLLRIKDRNRFWMIIPLLAAVIVLVKVGVLAGLVGVFAGGFLILPLVVPVPDRSRKAITLAVAAVIVVCFFTIFFVDMGDGLFHEVHEILHGRMEDTFGSGRIHIWKQVLQQTPSQLWFGSGPDTMLHAQMESFTRYDKSLGGMIVSLIDVAHNEYLNILFHQGIFALIAYLAMVITLSVQWVKHAGGDAVTAMLGGGAWCYCVQAFFGFSMCMTAPFFWLTLALLENRTARKNIGGARNAKKISKS